MDNDVAKLGSFTIVAFILILVVVTLLSHGVNVLFVITILIASCSVIAKALSRLEQLLAQ